MPDPTRPDLLARYEALNFQARALFEVKHGLPRNFISKMYQGAYYSALGGPTVARFEAAIGREERGEGPGPPPIPMGRPPKVDTSDPDVGDMRNTLKLELEEAETIDALERSTRSIGSALLDGAITEKEAQVLEAIARARLAQLKAKLEAEDRAKDGSELVIRHIHVPNWTGGPLPQ